MHERELGDEIEEAVALEVRLKADTTRRFERLSAREVAGQVLRHLARIVFDAVDER